jgi:hypothetical protein
MSGDVLIVKYNSIFLIKAFFVTEISSDEHFLLMIKMACTIPQSGILVQFFLN